MAKKPAEPRVTESKLKVPETLKIDQRRYLVKRISAVFDQRLRDVHEKIRYSSHTDPVGDALSARRGELGLQYLASCEAGEPKAPYGCSVSSRQRTRRTEVYELVTLSQAEEGKIRLKYPSHPTTHSAPQSPTIAPSQSG